MTGTRGQTGTKGLVPNPHREGTDRDKPVGLSPVPGVRPGMLTDPGGVCECDAPLYPLGASGIAYCRRCAGAVR